MRHPFINNRMLILYYGLFWFVVTAANILITVYWYNNDLEHTVLMSAVGLVLYPTLGASIWYIVNYSGAKDNDWIRITGYHLIGATVLNFLWIYLGFIIVKAIDSDFLDLMNKTLPTRILFGYVFYSVYVVFFYAINYYQFFKEKIKKEAELKALVREAELSALKSQINPHFLFNSLNSISSLTISNPSKAQEMVINLSSFMRYSLQHDQEEIVSLEDELGNIKLYLAIEKVRFGKKLNPVFEMEGNCFQAKVPNMILQPLYENAIKYGVYEATGPLSIVTSCSMENGNIQIVIENEYEADTIKKRGEGIGLRNIQQRLELIYGSPELIRVQDNKTSFRVELIIPQNKQL